MPNPIVQISGAKVTFGGEVRLRLKDLSIHSGEKVLVVGHNGSGKTSLINLIAGVLQPTTGTIERPQTVALFGHQPMLFSSLSVEEHFNFWQGVYRCATSLVKSLINQWGLVGLLHRLPAQLSRGEQARVSLARTLLIPSELILLDEPTNALDAHYSSILNEVLLSSKKTLCVSSHNINPLAFSRALILRDGEIIDDTTASLAGFETNSEFTKYLAQENR